MRLQGKVALITGSGSGLGRAASVLFAREGAMVAGCGRRREPGDETVQLVEEIGGKAVFVPGDVAKAADVERIVGETVATFGRIDILVNNASILFASANGGLENFETIMTLTEENLDELYAINIKGVFLVCKAALPLMIEQGGGTIVNVGSNAALLGYPLVHGYGASKAAVSTLTRNIAATFAGQGIRANSIAAGIFDSPMAASIKPFVEQVGPLFNPLARLGTIDEIAQTLLFLASDESSFVQGAELVVDGGQSMRALPPIDLDALNA